MTPFACRGDVKHGKWCPGCPARRALASPSTVAADVIEGAVGETLAERSESVAVGKEGVVRDCAQYRRMAVDRLLAERGRGA